MAEIDNKKIMLHSVEVNEVLSSSPNWIIRWGITVVSIFIITGLCLSWFISFPDVVSCETILTPATFYKIRNHSMDEVDVSDSRQWIARCHLSAVNASKLKSGQQVNILMNDYLTDDMLQARLTRVIRVSGRNEYMVILYLKNGLKTVYGKRILYQKELHVRVDVLTDSTSVLQRIVQKMKK